METNGIVLKEDPEGFPILNKYGFIQQPYDWEKIGRRAPEELYAILKIAKEQDMSSPEDVSCLYQFKRVSMFCRCCGQKVELYDWRRPSQEPHNCNCG